MPEIHLICFVRVSGCIHGEETKARGMCCTSRTSVAFSDFIRIRPERLCSTAFTYRRIRSWKPIEDYSAGHTDFIHYKQIFDCRTNLIRATVKCPGQGCVAGMAGTTIMLPMKVEDDQHQCTTVQTYLNVSAVAYICPSDPTHPSTDSGTDKQPGHIYEPGHQPDVPDRNSHTPIAPRKAPLMSLDPSLR